MRKMKIFCLVLFLVVFLPFLSLGSQTKSIKIVITEGYQSLVSD